MVHKTLSYRIGAALEAGDGADAVVQVEENLRLDSQIDVILMDFMMPVMDGPTATKKIRELGYSGLIIGLTGNTWDSDMNLFLAHGANRVMLKPLDLRLFDEIVQGATLSLSLTFSFSSFLI